LNHTNLKIILLILISNTVLGQKPTKSEGYQSDFDYLMQKLIETHPDPYLGYGFGTKFIKATKLPTDIQVFVLTSPQTFSAAYHFTYFLKKLGRTQIIGVASKQAGNSFMETTNFTLPHTKISGSISNSRQVLFKHNPKLGKILQPDYQMKWHHFKKYEFDKNAEILKAIEIIENKQK